MHWPKIRLFQSSFSRKATIVLLVTTILLSLLLVFFQLSQRSLIQSLAQMNNEFVQQVDIISGALLEVIRNTSMQMFYSASLTKLRTNDSLTNAERVSGFRDLGQRVSSSTFLSSAIIYNSNSDTIYASDGHHIGNASQRYQDRSTFELMEAQAKHGSTGPTRRQTADGDTYSFLFFESNMPDSGSLLLNVQASWYEKHLLGMSSEQNSVVVSSEGEILVASDNSLTEKVKKIWPTLLERFENDSGDGFILERGSKSGWMYSELTNLGGYYLRAFETDTILPGLAKVRNSVVGLLTVVSAILMGGALYTLFAFYLPFKAIREALQKDGNADEDVVQQVDRLLEGKMEQQLTKRMDGILQGEEMDDISYPAVLILVASSDSEAIRDVVGAFTSLPSLTALISFGCAVIVGSEDSERMLELCLNITNATQARCLYGKARDSASELAQCYGNLLDLWQQRFLYPGQQVLSETLTTTYHSPLDFATQDAEPLFSSLRAGDLDEARAIWKGIFEKIRDANFNDFRFYTRYILKYLNTMQSELGLEPLPNVPNLFDHLEDVAELHQLLDTIFGRIVAGQVDLRKNHLQQLAAKIDERITVGYKDDNLSAQSIADEMGMNAVYLGRLYRESAGISIGEALKRTRIENAKRLLLETSDSVKEIASRVGFPNNKYFFVVFKELVGITPKEFQTQARGENP